jgi:peroxiredoxin
MIRALLARLLGLSLLLAAAAPAMGQGRVGQAAPDFPPGPFSDGRQYSLEDARGKLMVLFFFEPKCPKCRASIPDRSAVVKALKGKPVRFLAVAANVILAEATAYQQGTGLAMPVYADSLGLMQKRYGQQISLKNIWQFRVIDPNGKVIGNDMSKDALENALKKVNASWKYAESTLPPKLEPALELLEWGQYASGMKYLAPQRKSSTKTVADSANKIYDELKKDGDRWKEDAEGAAESDPVKAYDLYTRISTLFAGDELAKGAAEPLKKLAANKKVIAELAARKALAGYVTYVGKLTPVQKAAAAKVCQDIVKRYPDTPTGDKAALLAKELGN